MDTCANCGHTRIEATGSPCVCIPAAVWRAPQMIAAVERLDIIAVIRLMRSHPLTKHLSQTALARLTGTSQATISKWEAGKSVPDPRRAILTLHNLGAPGTPEERRRPLPNRPLPKDTSLRTGEETETALDPSVVITTPCPLHVQVAPQGDTDASPPATAALYLDDDLPRLVVPPASTWSSHTNQSGTTTVWVRLKKPSSSG